MNSSSTQFSVTLQDCETDLSHRGAELFDECRSLIDRAVDVLAEVACGELEGIIERVAVISHLGEVVVPFAHLVIPGVLAAGC